MRTGWTIIAALLLITASAASAQTPVDTVIVHAPKAETPEQAARTDHLARHLSLPTPEGQLARWNRPICLAVGGFFNPSSNEEIKVRLETMFRSAGQRVEHDDCTTNFAVIFTNDQAEAISRLAREHPVTFFGQHAPSELKAFVADVATDPRPVVWWRVSSVGAAWGEVQEAPSNGFYGRFPIQLNAPMVKAAPSRTTRNTVADMERVAAFVDLGAVNGLDKDALCAYLVMGGLTQIDAKADLTDVPTVLNVFKDKAKGREPPTILTRWDRAYISALQHTNADVAAGQQGSGMAFSMQAALGPKH